MCIQIDRLKIVLLLGLIIAFCGCHAPRRDGVAGITSFTNEQCIRVAVYQHMALKYQWSNRVFWVEDDAEVIAAANALLGSVLIENSPPKSYSLKHGFHIVNPPPSTRAYAAVDNLRINGAIALVNFKWFVGPDGLDYDEIELCYSNGKWFVKQSRHISQA